MAIGRELDRETELAQVVERGLGERRGKGARARLERDAQRALAELDLDVRPVGELRRRVVARAPGDADRLDALGRADVEAPRRRARLLVVMRVQPPAGVT